MPRDVLQPHQPPLRAEVERLEAAMLALPQLEIPVRHGFGPGFYARSILIPAGATLTGKVHATAHIFMVTQGDITLITDDGVQRVQAPYQAICQPGIKRAGHAHTDTVCVNIHITPETDLGKLEAALIAAPALPAPKEPVCLG
jgi:quercetin dioxygenase-like cupin family protein